MNDPGSDGQDHAVADKEKAQKKQDPLIRNGTPDRLRICFSDGDSLVFAPLQVQDVNGDRRPQLRKLIDQNILTLVERLAASTSTTGHGYSRTAGRSTARGRRFRSE
jgi:predicted component of type VI protein secretion system